MSFETIIIEKKDQVGIITLNRPQKFNTFNSQMAEELNAALRQLDEDAEVRVVIIKGAGKVFSTGIDVTEDESLKKILERNRDEEKEHASMLLEWIRRNDEAFAKTLKTYLFQEGKDITQIEETKLTTDKLFCLLKDNVIKEVCRDISFFGMSKITVSEMEKS